MKIGYRTVSTFLTKTPSIDTDSVSLEDGGVHYAPL